ncbi:class I SAM-dependent methyltransferase [Acidimicrobiia bacterium]|nr:class I SAM-dependent methyltransferase [Acidimicrobiia bacterium]
MFNKIINFLKANPKKVSNLQSLSEISDEFKSYMVHFQKEDAETTWEYGIFSDLINEAISDKNDLTIVEIGVARAGNVENTFKILDSKISKYIGVDPYVSGYDDSDVFSQKLQKELDYCYSYVINKIKDKRFILYRASSEIVAPLIEDESVDAIFIDGDHTYEGVLRDISIWKPKVKKNGIIVGDDYPLFSGVKEAVKESFTEFKLRDNCWYSINPNK